MATTFEENGKAREIHVGLLVPVLLTLGFALHFLALTVVAEDAFITFRFAQNLAGGHGIVWNIGEPPVEGYTNFLWMMMSAGVIALHMDPELWSLIFGAAAGLGSVAITYQWSRRLLGLNEAVAWIPAAMLIATGPFVAWAGSGMETTLFGFLILAASYLFVSYWRGGGPGTLAGAAALFALSAMTRPEGMMVFGVLGLLALVLVFSKPTVQRWQILVPIVVFFGIFGPYFLWRYDYFGFLLPNTFYAKTGGGALQVKRGLHYTIFFTGFFVLPLALVALAGVFERGRSPFRLPEGIRTLGVPARLSWATPWLVPLVLATVYSGYIVVVGGDYMAMFRFFAPIVPFFCLILGGALSLLGVSRVGPMLGASVVLALLLLLVHSTAIEARYFPKLRNNHGTWRGLQLEQWHASRLRTIGEYFESIRTGYDQSVATDGIGAIAYVADMKVIGMHGLVDLHIAHKEFEEGELGSGLPGHERGDLPYILSKKPTYVMYNRELTADPFGQKPDAKYDPVAETLASDYELTSVEINDPRTGEKGYFTYYTRVAP